MARSSNSKRHKGGFDESLGIKPTTVLTEGETVTTEGPIVEEDSTSKELEEALKSLEESETVKSISLSDDCNVEMLELITKNLKDFKELKEETERFKKELNSEQDKIVKLLEKMVKAVSDFPKLFSKDDFVKKITEEVFTLIKNDEDFKELVKELIDEKFDKPKIKKFVESELKIIKTEFDSYKKISEEKTNTYKKEFNEKFVELSEKIEDITQKILVFAEFSSKFDENSIEFFENLIKDHDFLKPLKKTLEDIEIRLEKLEKLERNVKTKEGGQTFDFSSEERGSIEIFETEIEFMEKFFENLHSKKNNEFFSKLTNIMEPFLKITTDKETENLFNLKKILERLESKSERETNLLKLLKEKKIKEIEKVLSSEDEKSFKEEIQNLINFFSQFSRLNETGDRDTTLIDNFITFFKKNPSLKKEKGLKKFLDNEDKQKFLLGFVEIFSLLSLLKYFSKFSKDKKNIPDIFLRKTNSESLKTKLKDKTTGIQSIFDDIENIDFKNNEKLSKIIIKLKDFFEIDENLFLIGLKKVFSDFSNDYKNEYSRVFASLKLLQVPSGKGRRMIVFYQYNEGKLLLERICPKKAFFDLRCSEVETLNKLFNDFKNCKNESREKFILKSAFKMYHKHVDFLTNTLKSDIENNVKKYFCGELLLGYKNRASLDKKREELAKNFVEGIVITLLLGELMFRKMGNMVKEKDLTTIVKEHNINNLSLKKIEREKEKLKKVDYEKTSSNFLKLYGKLIKGVKNSTIKETKKNCFWEIFKKKKTIISKNQINENILDALKEGRKIVENFYGKDIIEKELNKNQITNTTKSSEKEEAEEKSLDNLKKKSEAKKISETRPPSNKEEKTSSKTRETGENKTFKPSVKDIQKSFRNKFNFETVKEIKGLLPAGKKEEDSTDSIKEEKKPVVNRTKQGGLTQSGWWKYDKRSGK